MYFLEPATVKAAKGLNLRFTRIVNCLKLTSSLLENHQTQQEIISVSKLIQRCETQVHFDIF